MKRRKMRMAIRIKGAFNPDETLVDAVRDLYSLSTTARAYDEDI